MGGGVGKGGLVRGGVGGMVRGVGRGRRGGG